jgi:hypothetical protein
MNEIAQGQCWKERDGRFNRTVVIVAVNRDAGRVAIRTIDPVSGMVAGRLTWASIARFNGKVGGYVFAREAA